MIFINIDIAKLSDKYVIKIKKNTGKACPELFIMVLDTINNSG
tara:strand:+ start:555 stop:683 length:129 start_codon:yes stop_codon:yes gene_type:complete